MATGTATIDFGVLPGASDASVTITGQAAIVSGSFVEAWIRPVATADHSVDEHLVEEIRVVAHSIVAATGFTISGFCTNQLSEPDEHGMGGGGYAPRLYGLWTVAWAWV